MSGMFTLITCVEVVVAGLIIWGFKNEKKLINFENYFIRFVAALIREHKRKKCKMKNAQLRAEKARELSRALENDANFNEVAEKDNIVYFGDYVA